MADVEVKNEDAEEIPFVCASHTQRVKVLSRNGQCVALSVSQALSRYGLENPDSGISGGQVKVKFREIRPGSGVVMIRCKQSCAPVVKKVVADITLSLPTARAKSRPSVRIYVPEPHWMFNISSGYA